jgi:hypothetical protein
MADQNQKQPLVWRVVGCIGAIVVTAVLLGLMLITGVCGIGLIGG